jgi:hypothetical protein
VVETAVVLPLVLYLAARLWELGRIILVQLLRPGRAVRPLAGEPAAVVSGLVPFAGAMSGGSGREVCIAEY